MEVTKNLEKYFHSLNFVVSYGTDIRCDESIGSIPALSAVLPVAWITHADVEVGVLDNVYFRAANEIRDGFKVLFPRGAFDSELFVGKQVDNTGAPSNPGYGLNFSGGVDATYSLLHNIELKPELNMIFGADMSLKRSEEIEKVKKYYSKFASDNYLRINFVTTNARDNIDMWRLTHDFQDVLRGHFWGRMEIGLFHAGLMAPLSMGRFDHLLVAASSFSRRSLTDPKQTPNGSIPVMDEKIAWANLKVRQDGIMDRQDKVPIIVEYSKDHPVWLRVCLEQVSENCNECHKCLRTMFSLLVAGADPNDYGFVADESTLKLMKERLQGKRLTGDVDWYWRRMQHDIPNEVKEIIPGLREFCEWLRKYDLSQAKEDQRKSRKFSLYYKIPFEIGNLFYNPDKKRD